MKAKNYPYVGDYNLDPPEDEACEQCDGDGCSFCNGRDDEPYDQPEPDFDYYPY